MIALDDSPRQFCADALAGRAHDMARGLDLPALDAIVATAEFEGITVALHASLPAERASPLKSALAGQARAGTARGLLCLAQARAIQRALRAADIPCLWLKGVALGQWLFPEPNLRELADLDLLLPDHATAMRAAEVLAPLGYVLPNPHIAGDLVVHELLAWSQRAQLELDLHWDLNNYPLLAGRIPWERLDAEAIALPALGEGARGLSPVHAFLHACSHRAANALTGREDRLRWLYDIHLLALRFDTTQWQRVISEATNASLADPCASALHACQRVFATPIPDAVVHALDASAKKEAVQTERLGRWSYWQVATWRTLPDLSTRLRWLRQLLFPDMAHLRVRYGTTDASSSSSLILRRLWDGIRRLRGYTRQQ